MINYSFYFWMLHVSTWHMVCVKLGSQYDDRLSFCIVPFHLANVWVVHKLSFASTVSIFTIYTLLTWLMRSHEFPLICLHVDVGIESKSILPFRSFHIVSSYDPCSQMDEIDGSLWNEMKWKPIVILWT